MKLKKIIVCALFVLVLALYFKAISTPLYPGRLTVDINNTTLMTISNAVLEFESANNTLVLPDIKPLERIIIVAPSKIAERPLNTRVFLNYNDQRTEILGEYHALNGDKYNNDTCQFAKAILHNKSISSSTSSGIFGINAYTNIKPYMRIIDMDI